MGDMKNSDEILERKLKGKRPYGRPNSKWKDNIKTDLKEIGYECVVFIIPP
jgi:hypothetical protein